MNCHYLIAALFFLVLSSASEDLPKPRIVILGQTGTGKSTLANVLIGQSPDCKNCTFPICTGMDSCTKETKYATGNWLGQGIKFTVVDTPGFGDSDKDENTLIDEMTQVLKDNVKGANALMLLINSEQQRFNTALQQMVREMQALFGDIFWQNAIIGVSHWSYNADSIAKRKYTGMTEEKFIKEWNAQLEEKFHINITLPGVFIDSFSQQPWSKEDVHQQEVFKQETQKLLDFAQSKSIFAFKTVEDVLKENQDLKSEVERLNSVIDDDIANINKRLDQLKTDVDSNKSEMESNNKNVSAALKNHDLSIDDIKMTNNLQDSAIKKNDEIIAQQGKDISQDKANNDAKNQAQDSLLANLDAFPLGTILPWVNRPSTGTSHYENVPADGWVVCDGRIIPDGVWKGAKTPNLNGEGRFIRGGSLEQILSLESHMVEDHVHADPGHSHADAGHTHTDAGHTHQYQHEADAQGGCGRHGCGYHPVYNTFTSAASHANIQASKANIQASKSNMGGMANGSKGSETRPVNMRVLWIIKAW